jgi:hypothetical protein
VLAEELGRSTVSEVVITVLVHIGIASVHLDNAALQALKTPSCRMSFREEDRRGRRH